MATMRSRSPSARGPCTGVAAPNRLVLITVMITVSAVAIGVDNKAVAAEPAGVSPISEMAEVVVTAQRHAENVQNVPIAVTAISAGAIKDRDIQSLSDVQNQVPGLKFGEFSASANVSLRGVGSTFTSGNGQSSVAIYVDGVYLPQIESLSMGQADLAGIEVLKGPQGTLYGRNSTGGVVNFTTNAPTNQFSYGATVGYGNYDDIRAEGYVSGPITDRIRLRLFVRNEDHDGYVTNDFTGQKLENLRSFGGRVSLDADVTDRWKTEIRVSSFKDNFAGPVSDEYDPKFALVPAPYNDFNDYRVNYPGHPASARNNVIAVVKNTVKLSDQVRLVSTTGFNDFLETEALDPLSDSLFGLPEVVDRRSSEISQEFNLIGETKKTSWILGAFYLHQVVNQTNFADLSNLVGLTPFHSVVGPVASSVIEFGKMHSVEDSGSLFGDLSYSLAHGTKVYGGLRVTYDEVKQGLTQGVSAFGAQTDTCSAATDPQSLQHTAVTGRIGVQQEVSSTSMVYVQYSHGYKSPGFSQSTCLNEFAAETLDAEEVGYKSQWFNHRLTFNAAAFHYGYDNLQLEVSTIAGVPVVNAPKAHIWGFESNVVARLRPDLRIDAALELLDASYDQFLNQDPNNGVALGTNLAGVHLNNAPKASGNFGLEFDQHLVQVGAITWRAEVSATTKYNIRELDEPYTIQNAYGLVNLYSTYRTPDEHYILRLYAKNVGDVARLGGETGFHGALGSFGPPRTYGAEISVRY